MKKGLVWIMLCYMVVGLVACGGGGSDESASSQHVPGISNLQYSPTAAVQGQGSGAVTVTGTINFIDSDANISTLTIETYDSLGSLLKSNTISLTNTSGLSAGTIGIVAIVDTTVKKNYSFRIFVTDTTGLQSNVLSGTFSVT